MAFELRRKESVRKGIRRCGHKRLEQALCMLEHCERAEAVHETRKVIKQVRALLRLARSAIGEKQYDRCSDLLREAAAQLAEARDAHVNAGALKCLIRHFGSQVAPRSFRGLEQALAAECRQRQVDLVRTGASRKAARLLKKCCAEFAGLEFKSSGWQALGPGLERCYAQGRRRLKSAARSETPEHFHEWRKRAKDLFHQIGLLCPIWPEQMNAAQAELKQLTQFLGDDHDLFMLEQVLCADPLRSRFATQVEVLKPLLNSRQDDLRAQALALGKRFYHERPSLFCKRLRQYWKRWRRESEVLVHQ